METSLIVLYREFFTAVAEGDLVTVNRLLQDHPGRLNPGQRGNRALCCAAENGHASANGHTEVVERLLQDPRTDPSVKNNDAIWKACLCHHMGIIRCLLQDPRIYHRGPFSELPDEVREEALYEVEQNTIQFDLPSELSRQDKIFNLQVRISLQIAHGRACRQVITMMRSGTFAQELQEDAQSVIVWMAFGHVLFPMSPPESRFGRISEFVSSVTRQRPLY